jgi:uncharacterized protein YukE
MTADPWAGVWIAEDIDHIAEHVRGGDWIDPVLRGPASPQRHDGDGDVPAWVVERLAPLAACLERLAGDTAQIEAHARTWRQVAAQLHERALELDRAVRFDVAYWGGAAGSAYRASSQQRHDVIDGLARSAGTLALITQSAGRLVDGVRARIRAELASAVERLSRYTGKNLTEINAEVAGCAARIGRTLRALVASLRRLRPLIERVDRCVDALKELLRRADHTHAAPEEDPPKKPLDPEDEAMRVHDLGVDPAVARYRPNEAQTAALVEIQLGVTLRRAAPGEPADWVDEVGRTYDAVGPFPARYFARQWTQVRYQLSRHLEKADLVPVDVSEFTADQTARVKQHISDNDLGPRIFLVGE